MSRFQGIPTLTDNRFSALLLAAILQTAVSGVQAAPGDEVLVSNEEVTESWETGKYAQSFVAPVTGFVTDIEFMATGTDSWDLKFWEGSDPHQPAVYSQNYPQLTSVGQNFVRYALDIPVKIVAGQSYTFGIESGSDFSFWHSGDEYAGGISHYFSTSDNEYVGLSNWDMSFRLRIEEAALPVLTSFASAVAETEVSTAVTIDFDSLIAQGDESYVDGAVEAFIVKQVSNGSLQINGNPWQAGSNDRISAARSAQWTPPAGVVGSFTVFQVTAVGGVQESVGEVPVQVKVNEPAPVPGTEGWDVVTIDTTHTPHDASFKTAYQSFTATAAGYLRSFALQIRAGENWELQVLAGAGADGTVLHTQQFPAVDSLDSYTTFILDEQIALVTGNEYSIKLNHAAGITINSINSFHYSGGNGYYLSSDGYKGMNDFMMVLTQTSSPLPRLSGFEAPVVTTLEDEAVSITLATLLEKGDESYSQGEITAFRVRNQNLVGTLLIGGDPYDPDTNSDITDSRAAEWTGIINQNGLINAFEVYAVSGAESSDIPVQVKVDVVPVSDEFSYHAIPHNPHFIEHGAGSELFADIRYVDGDASGGPDGINRIELQVSTVGDGSEEYLVFRNEDIPLSGGSGAHGAGETAWEWSVSSVAGTVTVSITLEASLETAVSDLKSMAYRHDGESFTGAERTVTLALLQGADNAAIAAIGSSQSKVTLVSVNDAPVITGIEGGTATVTAGALPAVLPLFTNAGLSDLDSADLSGGLLYIRSDETAYGSWGLHSSSEFLSGGDHVFDIGDSITVAGDVLGEIHLGSNGQGGSALWIDFTTAEADIETVRQLLSALTFRGTRVVSGIAFRLYISDGHESQFADFSLTVLASAPIITGLQDASSNGEQNAAVAINAGNAITLADADNAYFTGGRLTITRSTALTGNFTLTGSVSLKAGNDEIFAVGEKVLYGLSEIGTVITDGQGAASLVIEFSGTPAVAALEKLLNDLKYVSNEPGTHTFSLTVSDAAADSFPGVSAASTFSVVISGVPMLSEFSAPVVTTEEDSSVSISFSQLADKGDESYTDGDIVAFKVKSVASGTLLIDGSPFSAADNADITAAKSAEWTPAADQNGTLDAFAVVAVGGDLESDTPVTVQVTVTAVDDLSQVTGVAANPAYIENGSKVSLFTSIVLADVDGGSGSGGVNAFQVQVSPVSDEELEVLVFRDEGIVLTDGQSGSAGTGSASWSYEVSVTGDVATVEITLSATLAETATALQEMAYRHDGESFTGTQRVVALNWFEDADDVRIEVSPALSSQVSLTEKGDGVVLTGVDGESLVVTAGADPVSVPFLVEAELSDVDSTTLTELWIYNFNYPSTSSGNWGLLAGSGFLSGSDIVFAEDEKLFRNDREIGEILYGFSGQGGNDLYIGFNGEVTLADLDALLAALTYSEPAVLVPNAFDLAIGDDTGYPPSAYASFSILAKSSPPVIGNLADSLITAATGSTVAISGNGEILFSDADSTHFDGGEINIERNTSLEGNFELTGNAYTSGDDGGFEVGETVSADSTVIGTVVSAGQGADDLLIRFNADSSAESVQGLLNALAYSSTENGIHRFTLQISDAAAGETTATSEEAGFIIVVSTPSTPSPSTPDVIDNEQTVNGNVGNVTVTENGVLQGNTVSGQVTNQGTVNINTLASSGRIIGGNVQGTISSQGHMSDVNLLPGTTVDGGSMGASIQNQGQILNVRLLAGTSISGGEVGGNITGNPESPATLQSTILSGSVLSNVVIGRDAVLPADIVLGENVRFESPENIPAGLELSGALNPLFWRGEQQIPGVELNASVLSAGSGGSTLFDQLQQLPDFQNGTGLLSQNPATGELEIDGNNLSARVFPVRVVQAEPDAQPGISITADGDIALVTGDGQLVVSYPVSANTQTLESQLTAAGLQLNFDDRANLQISTAGEDDPAQHFQARPDIVSTPAGQGQVPGLVLQQRAVPANTEMAVMVYENGDGVLMQQALHPVPSDWPVLRDNLKQIAGSDAVSINEAGVITIDTGGGVIRAMADYTVQAGNPDESGGSFSIDGAGDRNGDGVEDYLMVFPDGSSQILYQLPSG